MTDFEKQKQDAAERVRRMNDLYRKRAGIETPIKEESPHPIPPKTSPHRENKTPLDFLKILRFDALKSDPDRLLLFCVFLLLSSEKCDEKLLYALLYIML
jgi:hypothetical protein